MTTENAKRPKLVRSTMAEASAEFQGRGMFVQVLGVHLIGINQIGQLMPVTVPVMFVRPGTPHDNHPLLTVDPQEMEDLAVAYLDDNWFKVTRPMPGGATRYGLFSDWRFSIWTVYTNTLTVKLEE